jgi:peptidoglycan/xylan/chitin deacetylase (PgdA/CDA1 family)
MQAMLTFDYELFFGENSGTVYKCMLEPTDRLLDIAERNQVPMTFFIDIGFLLKMEEYLAEFQHLSEEYNAIIEQFQRMQALGCDLQLHIHPHWENSRFDGEKWQIITDGCYKLSDFSVPEIDRIVRKYYAGLKRLTGKPPVAYRAGGWCIQPFLLVEKTFQELQLRIDSSVFPGGEFQSPHYAFDFTSVAPFSSSYSFQSDVCIADEDGFFREIPIASWKYSPLFYWKLYILGRLNPKDHQMIGDGNFVAQPGRKKSVLTKFTWNHVSSDGYYASMLLKQARVYEKKGVDFFVVIGHPKGMTHFSLKALEVFVNQSKHFLQFVNFEQCVG